MNGQRDEDRVTDLDDLATVLAAFTDRRLLVVGDVMVDEYAAGTTLRVSDEAPVPVTAVERQWSGLGGAANVARQARALGAEVSLVGATGADVTASELRAMCDSHGIEHAGLVTDPSRITTRKLRVLSGRQQTARVDFEDTHPVAESLVRRMLTALEREDPPDAVVISDYAKGTVVPSLVSQVVASAGAWGVPCLVDPRPGPFDRYHGADVVKANMREFEAARRVVAPDETDPHDAARRVLDASPVDRLVVTMGDRGMLCVGEDGTMTSVPAVHTEVPDVAGAGDTAIAVLALGLAVGLSLDRATYVSNLAAGAAVRRSGVSVVSAPEVLAVHGEAAPRTQVQLHEAVARWRADGLRIVMTNGCFDLLHAGHLHLLERAAELGDVLVVAVNSDDSVRGLKGEGRPLVTGEERAHLVAALRCVDAVVLFDEPTPLRLIEAVRPDVLVKGGDYAAAEVVGSEVVTASGGRVEIVPLLSGHSTTATIAQMRAARAQPDMDGSTG